MTEVVATGNTVTEAKAKLDRMMGKIRALLDKADSTEYEEERSTLQAKAEELMRKYRIDQEQLIAADPIAAEPIRSDIDVCEWGSEFRNEYYSIFDAIASHCGIRSRFNWIAREDGSGWVGRCTSIGYEGDLRYAEYLFTAARIVFAERLEPVPNPALGDAENVYRLRSAGITRNRIATLLWGLDTHAAHARAGKLYKEACAAKGEDPAISGRNVNAKTFRACYAREFVSALYSRLWGIRNAADSTGGAMVLAGRSERVDEAFYALYPEQRPGPPVEGSETKKAKEKTWSQADEARFRRNHYSPAAVAAGERGRSAVLDIDIDRAPKAQRLGESKTRTSIREVLGLETQ